MRKYLAACCLILPAVLALAVLYGCDRADPPAERQEGSVGAKGPGASSPPEDWPALACADLAEGD